MKVSIHTQPTEYEQCTYICVYICTYLVLSIMPFRNKSDEKILLTVLWLANSGIQSVTEELRK